jgi:hypothetical protein
MRLKHWIGILGAAVFLLAWGALAVAFVVKVELALWTTLVVIAAFASEAMIWCLAAMLGLSVFEARREIWRTLTRPFRKAA